MAEDYCDLCDLPLSTCIHGMPAPAPTPEPARRTPAVRATRVTRTVAEKPVRTAPPSLLTPQAAFRPHILAVLQERAGAMEQADVLEELEILMDDVLKDRDRQTAPSGELRWHTAARKERKAMIDEGLMKPATPGVWELTSRGLGSH